jgi:hypothetical protein
MEAWHAALAMYLLGMPIARSDTVHFTWREGWQRYILWPIFGAAMWIGFILIVVSPRFRRGVERDMRK